MILRMWLLMCGAIQLSPFSVGWGIISLLGVDSQMFKGIDVRQALRHYIVQLTTTERS